MRFVDLFCGIGGFRLGLENDGHEHAQSAEWEAAPRLIYETRFGAAPDWSDVREIQADQIEGGPGVVWCGGFPCQDASSAGAGLGLLGGKRSSLVFRILGLARVARPEWLFLENVPGLLVRGRGFGNLLGVLARLGYGVAWRRLDSQFHGLAQRRKRVFIVACLGSRAGMRRAAEVLLEPPSMRGDPPTRGEAGARVARCLAASVGVGGAEGSRDELIHSEPVSKQRLAHGPRLDEESESLIWSPEVSPTIARSQGHHGHSSPRGDGSTPLVAGFNVRAAGGSETGYTPHGSPPARGGNPPGVVISSSAAQVTSPHNRSSCLPGAPANTLASSGKPETIARADGAWVRRLTPRECERIQGFPDDWTKVEGVSEGARYKALGNAVSVPVVERIARRLPS